MEISKDPLNDELKEELKESLLPHANFLQDKFPTVFVRHCDKCNKMKPPRTHHCKVCDKCCMNLDHHCVWVANCIGIHNKKFFFQYGLYVLIIDCILVPFYVACLRNEWDDLEVPEKVAYIYGVVIGVFTGLSSVLCNQMNFLSHVIRGQTLIEARFQQYDIWPFYMGQGVNVMFTLGRWWPAWILPLHPRQINVPQGETLGLTYYPMSREFC